MSSRHKSYEPQQQYHHHTYHQPLYTATKSNSISRSNTNCAYDPSASVPKTKITLAGAEATLLPSVWCRARDAASPAPILGDPYAQAILDHCDVDFTRGSLAHLHDERWARLGAGRAKALDDWCQAFVDGAKPDEPVQVLQIACGLDSRALRIRRGPNVRWIDLDRPLVVNLRERIYGAARWDLQQGAKDGSSSSSSSSSSGGGGGGGAGAGAGAGEYMLRNLSVTSDRWLRDIPQDRRTIVIIEGLLYHLSPNQVLKIIRDVVDHFGGPETDEGAQDGQDQEKEEDNDDHDEDYDDEKEGVRVRESKSHKGSSSKGCEIVFDVLGTIIKKRTSHIEWLRPTGIKVMSGFDGPEDILPCHPRLKLLETQSWDEMMRTERKAACAPPWFGPKGTMLASMLPSFWDFCQVMRFRF